ncbi:MAG: glycosyltransferase family 4 protein [Ruminococcus sp.]|jgi:glycosyltransferase involved in cell wall biosynthesis|uniref:glycosyltransferase family 4 protein n=1 Tax=uncultured Ruminococcus sp. TaxID=165186 RepID=UPI002637C62F|nr:glycosyltransferase family 4 protein [uncultured Ruminococcus sp.]
MRKIGFVIPWYGEDIPGGAEMELREVATHLQRAGMDVEILTTCVREFSADWNENYYSAGTAVVEDIAVRRFPVRRRDTAAFDRVNRRLMEEQHLSLQEEKTFVEEMVNSPQLYEYLKDASNDYALYVFIPYMFGTTYYGMQACPEKSVLIPCFHDEAYLYLRLFRQAYIQARGIIYNAMPEMELANKVYDFTTTEQICMGIGMDTNICANADAFRKAYRIQKPFLLYAGRKDAGKNVHTLLRYFAEYKQRHGDSDLQLVLIGGGSIEIPASVRDDVYDLGFVSRQDKYDAMAAAELLCQPSHNESFSLVIMESWLCGRPVLVHSQCAVTRDFARRANGGLYFRNYFEFEGCVQYILTHPEQARTMGQNGGTFVRENFDWDVIVEKYRAFFAKLTEE